MNTPAKALEITSFALKDDLLFHMTTVEGGTYLMGDDKGDDNEKPLHKVTLSRFQMGQHPVTQELWEAVIGSEKNPSRFRGPDRPVERINWYEAVAFCNLLSEQLGVAPVYQIYKTQKDPNNENEYDDIKWLVTPNWQADGFRLPTEAEWEYAARGGAYAHSTYEYAGSNELDKVGWYEANSQDQTHAVGLKAPNTLGLYDMSGNVWEWNWDVYDASYYQTCADKGIVVDPRGPEYGSYRVLRGGSWLYVTSFCRVAHRNHYHPHYRYFNQGFRLSRTV